MRSLILLVAALFSPWGTAAIAADKPIPDAFLEQMAKDLAEMQIPPQAAQAGMSMDFTIPVLQVTADNAKLRKGASPSADEIKMIPIGQELPVITSNSGWYAVATPDDKIGWVSAEDVIPTPGTNETLASYKGSLAEVLKDWKRYSEIGDALQAGAVEAQENPTNVFETAGQWFMLQALRKAAEFKVKYDDNEYMKVTGFDINISVPPSVGMNFEFK